MRRTCLARRKDDVIFCLSSDISVVGRRAAGRAKEDRG